MQNRSGNSNTKGADVTVQTQADRAAALDRFLSGGLDLPYLVGYHWFQYFDEPTPGRSFDGEDSNYGLVDVHDQPYAEITAALTRWNEEAGPRHRGASHTVPRTLPAPVAIRVRRSLGVEAGAGGIKPGTSLGDYGRDGKLSWVWKEASAEAEAKPQDGALRFSFKSGTGWGCGLGLKTPGANADGSADLRGGSGLELKLNVPKGLRYQVFVSESGVGDPGQDGHPGAAGADGESYSSPVLLGSGKTQAVQVAWEQLEARTSWGEQHGNRTVDLQALSQLDLAVGGGQGEGAIIVESVTLLR